MGRTDLELLTNYTMFEDFESNIRGGFVGLTKRHVKCNTPEMGELYDASPLTPDESLLFLDWNSMYPWLLTRSIPYAGFEYVTDITPFKDPTYLKQIDTSDSAEVDYFLIVDIWIPDYLKGHFDDFPLVVVNCNIKRPSAHTRSIGRNVNLSKSVKLVSGHFNMSKHGVDLELLQFYLGVGVMLLDVHRVIVYMKRPFFKPFIEHCAKQRRENRDNAVLNAIYKLLANSLYGRCIMDQRKYSVTSRLVRASDISKELAHPKFNTIRKVAKGCYLVTRSKECVVLKSPIYIGCVILQKAKLANLQFHYCVVKPSAFLFPSNLEYLVDPCHSELIRLSRRIIKSIYLVYTDTDSLCYHVVFRDKGHSIDYVYKHTFLKTFLDRSNFAVLDRSSDFPAGTHGRLKLETADNVPIEALFLTCKVYSIRLMRRQSADDTTGVSNGVRDGFEYKRAAKGCPRARVSKHLTHPVYKAVYEETDVCPTVTSCEFRFDARLSGMVILFTKKVPLSLYEDKRLWVNKDISVPYGSETSYEHGYADGDLVCVKGGIIVHAANAVNSNENDSLSNNEVGAEDTSVDDASLINILAQLMEESNSPSTSYDDALDGVEGGEGGIIVHPVNDVNSNENDSLSNNDVSTEGTSVDDASLFDILAQLMEDSNSPKSKKNRYT